MEVTSIIIFLGSLDLMIFTGLALVSAAIAAYNIYQAVQKQKEEESIWAQEKE
jgi:hypothetical protein